MEHEFAVLADTLRDLWDEIWFEIVSSRSEHGKILIIALGSLILTGGKFWAGLFVAAGLTFWLVP